MMPNKKPEPIRISTQGIEAKPVTMNEPDMGINWQSLVRLPPFQMYISELAPCPSDRDGEDWAMAVVEQHQSEGCSDRLYEKYVEWHKQKGYWPNEDARGRAL